MRPGEETIRPRTAAPLATRLAATALRRPTAVTVGGPGEARVRLAGSAGPVAWSAAAIALAAAARHASFGAAAAARLGPPCTSVQTIAMGAALANSALAVAVNSTAAQAMDEPLERVESACEVRRLDDSGIPALAATGHGGAGGSLSTLGGVVLAQAARGRLDAQEDSGVCALFSAAAVPRRLAVALRRGDPASRRRAPSALRRAGQRPAPRRRGPR
jgi:hypothetical protein